MLAKGQLIVSQAVEAALPGLHCVGFDLIRSPETNGRQNQLLQAYG